MSTAAVLRDHLASHHDEAEFLSLVDATGRSVDWTWGEFWRQVDRYRPCVAPLCSPSAPTLIFSLSQLETIAAFFAVICEGGLPAFFPPPNRLQDNDSYRRQQALSIGRIAPAGILVADRSSREALDALELDTKVVTLAAQDSTTSGSLQRFCDRLAAPGTLFVQHSSGTTGTKKAVEISGALLLSQYEALWRAIEGVCGVPPRIASWLPLYHDMGLLATLILPLLGRARVALVDPVSWVSRPQLLLDIIEQRRSTLAWMPNFAYRHYSRLAPALAPRDLSTMRLWVDCSEPCRAVDVERFEAQFASMGVLPGSVHGSYAMAEAVFAVSQSLGAPRRTLSVAGDQKMGEPIRAGDRRVLSSGAVLPGFDVRIVAEGRVLPEGHYGEITIAGPSVFKHYRGATPACSAIRDGMYHTGDLGAISEGDLFVFGRSKEVAIVNGKNVLCGDVEDALSAVQAIHPGRAVVFGFDNDLTGSQDLIIVAESRDGAHADAVAREIKELVLALFGVRPRDVRLVPDRWLVKSTSGKVARGENKAKYAESLAC